MTEIRFAQISDTHLPGTPANAFLQKVCREFGDPWDHLRSCLTQLSEEGVDFILHAGDMIHEGSREDYERMAAMFAEYAPGIPVIAAPGNHDRREVCGAWLREWKGGLENAAPEKRCIWNQADLSPEFAGEAWLPGGLRVLVLDTTREKREDSLSEAQLDWLESRLAYPSRCGTLLLLHHPPVFERREYTLPVTERFSQLVKNPEVLALFAGHTHRNAVSFFAGKPCFTADSLGVGMDFRQGGLSYTSRIGYLMGILDLETGLAVENRLLQPAVGSLTMGR